MEQTSSRIGWDNDDDDTLLMFHNPNTQWSDHSGHSKYITPYEPTIYGYIEVTMTNGKAYDYEIKYKSDYDAWLLSNLFKVRHNQNPLDEDKNCLPNTPNHDFIIIDVNEKDLTWTRSSRQVHECLPNAVNSFLSHWFGRSIDTDDKKWYANYGEKVTSDGCKENWTLTVTHQLLEPYEIGISRIFLPIGRGLSPEMYTWMGRLGTNPDYVKDFTTTNEEYLEKLGLGLEQINQIKDPKERIGKLETRKTFLNMFRFECIKYPIGPCIVLSSWGNATKISSHNGGASYSGPRSHEFGDWKIAIQLDWIKNLPYTEDKFPLDTYQEDIGTITPNFTSLKIIEKDGKKFSLGETISAVQRVNTKTPTYNSYKGSTTTYEPSTQGVISSIDKLTTEFKIDRVEARRVLMSCSWKLSEAQQYLVKHPPVIKDNKVWANYCPKCGKQLKIIFQNGNSSCSMCLQPVVPIGYKYYGSNKKL